MIEPTIGRVVLFRPKDSEGEEEIRHAAQVAFVHSTTMVNLGCINENGVHYNEQLVRLVQGDEPCLPGCCEWMPYQKGQAAKTEQLETALKSDEQIQDRIDELKEKESGGDGNDSGPDGTDESTDDTGTGQADAGEGDQEEKPVLKEPKKAPSKNVAKAKASAKTGKKN